MALSDIYQKASLVQIPSGYKSGTIYSVVPNNGDGDFTVTVDADATRVNKDGLIESVAADVPRLNYDFTNPQDPHLLLEPTRTNECLYSKTLSSWSELNGGSLQTITDNDAIAPDGSLTASTITFTDTGTSLLRQFSNKAYTSNKHSSSFYAKKISGNGSVFFGITDTETEFTPTDEWIRYEVNNVTPTDIGTNLFLDLNFDCSEGDKIAVWGMQLEEGTYSTSVVETEGSAVTRTADTCSLPNYSNLPTDYPLTVYWKGQVKEFNGFNCAFSIYKDGASGEFLTVSFNTASQILVRRAYGGSEDVDFINYSYSLGDILKIGIKFTSATTFKLFINGSEIYEETSGTSKIWDFNSVLIGQLRIASDTGNRNPCDVLMLFNEELTDSELQTLTS